MITRSRTAVLSCALACALGLLGAGCIKQMLLDGQIESTREASDAIETLPDVEVARAIAFSGLGQFEGMHYLAPDNEDALFMLTKGWAAASFGFIEDEMEQAEDAEGSDSERYLYQQARARVGYERAIFYGIKLLERRREGFEAARKNDETIKRWLLGFEKEDAPALFWTGYAWLSKTHVAKEDPAVVADLFIGVALMERAVALNEAYMFGSGHTTLGAYHARSGMAELDEAKRHFDKALALSGGKLLMAQFQLAAKYHCLKGDRQSYEKLLREVLDAGDVLPEARLTNAIAKRRARRYLGKERMKACGF